MNNELMFSTGKDDWATPPELFAALDDEFHFDLDPCATPETAKCTRYFTPADNGLAKTWINAGGAVFCNPPYSKRAKGKPGQEDWIKKCAEEGAKPGAVVVALLPARTDTIAFHAYIYHKAEIRFIKGRVKFIANGKQGDADPFPNMIVIFRGPKA